MNIIFAMGTTEATIRALDAAYVPFPSFKEWASQTIIDPVRWDRYKTGLVARSKGLSPEILERARNVATRAAALDTGAIEGLYEVDRGFTFTVAQETVAWESLFNAKGEHVRPLFEAQLHAYDYVLSLATKAEAISEAAIRVLHEEVCKAQNTYRVATAIGIQEQPLPKGQYKALPNHVRTRKGTDHSYAPVDMTPAEMGRFVGELRSEEFQTAHPVVQASYAHYGLVVIHPFADGNGRVARALASTFTYRALSIPIMILSEHKVPYLDSLERADDGNYQSFVDFMLARALDTIDLVDESIRTAIAPSTEASLAAFHKLYITKGGYSQDEVDAAGNRLLEEMMRVFTTEFPKHSHPKLSPSASITGMSYPLSPAYRFPVSGSRGLQLSIQSAAPAFAQVRRAYALLVPKDAAGDDDILLQLIGKNDYFRARVDELIPTLSSVLQIRTAMFAERVVNELMTELVETAKRQLGN